MSELRAEAAAIEAALPYNCEHVVCQSWFDEDEPMRGDIHHLFACESGCNSFRGNFPYIDFPDTQEIVRDACGRREEDGFEPGGGKGPAARATLYSYSATRGSSATGSGSSRPIDSRCCSHGTREIRSATTSATETPRSPGCTAIATR
jgi:Endonuclease I